MPARPPIQLDAAELHAIYAAHADDKDVQLKRQLWAKLLRTALGAEFVDSKNSSSTTPCW